MLPGTIGFLSQRIRPIRSRCGRRRNLEGEPVRRHRWPPRWSARLAATPAFRGLPLGLVAVPEHGGDDHAYRGSARVRGVLERDEARGLGPGGVARVPRQGCAARAPGTGLPAARRVAVAGRQGACKTACTRGGGPQAPAHDPAIPGWARGVGVALKVLHPAVLLVWHRSRAARDASAVTRKT